MRLDSLRTAGDAAALRAAALESASLEARRFAAYELARLSADDELEAVFDASEDHDVRFHALRRLLREPGPEAQRRALAALGDPDPAIRRHAASRLRHLADARAVDALLAAARSDADRETRMHAAHALANLRIPEAGDFFLEWLERPPDPSADVVTIPFFTPRRVRWWTRRAAAKTLAELGDARAEEPIRRLRRREPVWHRVSLTLALRRLRRARLRNEARS